MADLDIYPTASITAARIASEDSSMDAAAARVKSVWSGILSEHIDRGFVISSLKSKKDILKSGVTDRVVFIADPDPESNPSGISMESLLSIEYGSTHRIKKKDGRVTIWVQPGIHSAAKTIARM